MTVLLEGDRLKVACKQLVTGVSKHQMTVLSPVHTVVTGTAAGQIIALPSALTLASGWVYYVTNSSSEAVHVKDFLGSPIARLMPEEKLELLLLSNESSQGHWSVAQISISNNPVTNCLYNVVFESSGISKGKWLNTHHSVDSSKLPAVIPFDLCHLVGLSFANTQDKASASIKIYKNGTTDVFQDINVLEQKTLGVSLGKELLFKKGDTVSVYISAISNSGFTADSPQVTLFFKVVRP